MAQTVHEREMEIRQWIVERSQRDDRLYEQFGKPLESEHTGEFVAISDDGRMFIGLDEFEMVQRALTEFGSGNFAVRRIGFDYDARIRALSR